MNYNKFETALLAQCKQIGVPAPSIQPGDVSGSFSKEQGNVEVYHNTDGQTIAEVVSGFPSNGLKRKVVTEYTQFERQKTPDGSETIIKKSYKAGEKEPFFEGFTEFAPDGKLRAYGFILPDGTQEAIAIKSAIKINHRPISDDYFDLLFSNAHPRTHLRFFDS